MERLDADVVREALSYAPSTGEFHWRRSTRGRRAGSLAGGVNSTGYVQIRLGGKLYKAHRLAWLHHYGSWPARMIDHINRDKSDNRIMNLRDVGRSENSRNRDRLSNNTSGFTGVSQDRRTGKWGAYIRLGYFDTPEEAGEAYLRAKKLLEGTTNG